jgi:hypothetical protein
MILSYVASSEGGQLCYATDSGGSWRIVRVDAAGGDTAFALDTAGRVHLSYFRGGNPRHATNR